MLAQPAALGVGRAVREVGAEVVAPAELGAAGQEHRDEGHRLDVGGLVLAGPGAVEDGDGVADGALPVVLLRGDVDGAMGLAGAVGVRRRGEPVLVEGGGLVLLTEVEGDDPALVGEVVGAHADLAGVGVEALLEDAHLGDADLGVDGGDDRHPAVDAADGGGLLVGRGTTGRARCRARGPRRRRRSRRARGGRRPRRSRPPSRGRGGRPPRRGRPSPIRRGGRRRARGRPGRSTPGRGRSARARSWPGPFRGACGGRRVRRVVGEACAHGFVPT